LREELGMRIRGAELFGLAAGVVGIFGVVSGEVIRVDFGGTGSTTASPDVNGNAWNNFTPGAFESLVNVNGGATGIDLFATTGVGPGSNGGLTAPDAGLLGDAAIGSATEDYIFVSGSAVASWTLSGLDGTKVYELRFFGTRETGGDRFTRYTVTDGNGAQSATLQTSGAGAGTNVATGNDDDFAVLGGLVADSNGDISFDLSVESGGFGYLGLLEIVIVPTPGAGLALGAAGTLAMRRRR
jgi:hypothetical protein